MPKSTTLGRLARTVRVKVRFFLPRFLQEPARFLPRRPDIGAEAGIILQLSFRTEELAPGMKMPPDNAFAVCAERLACTPAVDCEVPTHVVHARRQRGGFDD